jgi:hypothetical protein
MVGTFNRNHGDDKWTQKLIPKNLKGRDHLGDLAQMGE